MEKYEKRKRFIVNTIFFSVIGIAVYAGCRYLLPVLVPFIAAFLIAAALRIPVKKIGGKSEKKQRIAAVISCSLFYALVFLLMAILGLKLLQGAGDLIANAPSTYNDKIAPLLRDVAERMEDMAASVDMALSKKIETIFNEFSQNVGQHITDLSVKAVRMLSGGATKIPGFIAKLIVAVISTFFILLDFDAILSFFRKFVPAEKEREAGRAVAYVKNVLLIYLKSYSLLFLLTFVELFAGFLILGIPYAPALAFAVAVFDILPILGTGGILLPWAAILLLMGNTALAVGMLMLYIVITVIRNILEPKIVGKQIGLHPLATLIFMFLGLKVLGIVGMVAFPVALSVLLSLEKNGIIHFLAKKTDQPYSSEIT